MYAIGERNDSCMRLQGERNYHIFSLMFSGMDREALDAIKLRDYGDYKYLPDDPGDDAKQKTEWAELTQAYSDVNFHSTEVAQLNAAIAAVLLFGELQFVDGDNGDAAVIENQDLLADLCHVLQVEPADLEEGLMTSVMNMRGEIITKQLNVKKSNNARNAVVSRR